MHDGGGASADPGGLGETGRHHIDHELGLQLIFILKLAVIICFSRSCGLAVSSVYGPGGGDRAMSKQDGKRESYE